MNIMLQRQKNATNTNEFNIKPGAEKEWRAGISWEKERNKGGSRLGVKYARRVWSSWEELGQLGMVMSWILSALLHLESNTGKLGPCFY